MKTKQEMWMRADELDIQKAVLWLPSRIKQTNIDN